MIKWKTTKPDGRALIGVGLELMNIQRLVRGEPILFQAEAVGLSGFDVAIHFGETKQHMLVDMEKAGIKLTEEMKAEAAKAGPEPTPQFPDGKISDDDEGALAALIGRDGETGKIVIDFGKDVKWLAMSADEAVAFAQNILKHARN